MLRTLGEGMRFSMRVLTEDQLGRVMLVRSGRVSSTTAFETLRSWFVETVVTPLLLARMTLPTTSSIPMISATGATSVATTMLPVYVVHVAMAATSAALRRVVVALLHPAAYCQPREILQRSLKAVNNTHQQMPS